MRWLLVVLSCVLAMPRAAVAEPTARPVVIVVGRPTHPYTLRMRAELESLGFEVEVVRERRSIQRAGRAVAVLMIDAIRRVEVRFGADLRRPPDAVLTPDERSSVEVEAVQIAERVRTVLAPVVAGVRGPEVGVEVPREPPHAAETPLLVEPPPSPRIASPQPRSIHPPVAVVGPRDPAPALQADSIPHVPIDDDDDASRLGFGLGAGAVFASQGSAIALSASVFYDPLAWLRVEVFVDVPLRPFTVLDAEGAAELHTGFLGGSASVGLEVHPMFTGFVGVRAAGVWLHTVGRASSGYVGVTDDVFTAAAMLDAGVRIRLGDTLSLSPRASVGAALAPVDVVFGGRDVTAWGLPLGAVGLNAEFSFPIGDVNERPASEPATSDRAPAPSSPTSR